MTGSRHLVMLLVTLRLLTRATALAQVVTTTPESAPAVTQTSAPRVQADVAFDVNTDGDSTWLQVTPTAGFTFDDHWSVEAGLPVFYLDASATEEGMSVTGIGDLYLSVSFDMSGEAVTAYATGTVGAPTGDADNDLGAGTTTWDLSGYVDRTFGRFTPSVYAGVGNNSLVAASSPTRQRVQSAGHLFHVEGWAEVEVWKALTLSAGVYAARSSGADASQVWADPLDDEETEYEETSPDDEGVQFVATATLTRALELSFWFSRSRPYAYNTYSVSLGVDLVSLFGRSGGAPPPDRRRIRR